MGCGGLNFRNTLQDFLNYLTIYRLENKKVKFLSAKHDCKGVCGWGGRGAKN